MSDESNGQATQAVNSLRPKLGGKLGVLDPAAIAKAEAALKNLAGNFGQWLNDEVARLEAARRALHDQGVNPTTAEALYFRAHDLKGLGATYGFPLVTRIGASLCLLTGENEKRLKAPLTLVDAHVDAIRSIVAQDIRTEDNPIGRALAESLEAQVAACG